MTTQTFAEGDQEVVDILVEEGVDLTNVKRIKVAQIRPGSFQPRQIFDQAALDELAEDLRVNGQTETGILNDMEDGTYELIAGERRWRALKQIGRATFRGAVVRVRDPKLLSRLAMPSNSNQVGLTDLEMLDAALKMRDSEHSEAEIAQRFGGKSVQWVSNLLTLDRLHPKIRPSLGSKKKGGFTRSVGMQLIRLAADQQLVAMREIRKGDMGEKRARRVVEAMLEDGAEAHPDARDRSNPTDLFVQNFIGSVGATVLALKRLNTGARRNKLGKLVAGDAKRVREKFATLQEAITPLLEALPAE